MPDLEGLANFVQAYRGSRGLSPIFVGRRAELGLVEQICEAELVNRLARTGSANGILCFTGAPGTGKTAFIESVGGSWAQPRIDVEGYGERLKKICAKTLGSGNDAIPIVVQASQEDLASTEALMKLCARHASPLASHKEGEVADLIAEMAGGRVETAMNALGGLALARQPVVLLLVDEAQDSENGGERKFVYSRLHRAKYPFPIIPIFVGLPDTPDVLKNVGVSRLGRGMHQILGLLSREECSDAIDMLLDRYDIAIAPEDRQAWRDLAMDGSDCFPVHLHSILLSMARVALDHEGRLDSNLVAAVWTPIPEEKESYYAKRRDNFSSNPREVFVAATVVDSLVTEGSHPVTTAEQGLAAMGRDGEDPVELVTRMIHNGFIERDHRGQYGIALEPFSDWLRAQNGFAVEGAEG